MLLDAIFLEELHQIFAHELRTVVGDDGLRDAKSANDVPLYEALYVQLSCGCHRLCFYPFGEVVDCHDLPLPPVAGGIGPTKSIAHGMNGQRLICGCSSLAGSASTGLQCWQRSHFCTNSLASWWMVGRSSLR